MDELDKALIIDLEANGYKKASDLAHSYGVSTKTIRRRIRGLVNENLIKMVVAPNFILLGYTAWARIGLKVKAGIRDNVAQILIANPSIYFVAYTLGRFDIIISVHLDSLNRLNHFVNSELTAISGILYLETILLISPRKYNLFTWPAAASMHTKSMNGLGTVVPAKNYILDKTDEIILEALMANGLIRPKALASKVGIGENVIRAHLRNLNQKEAYRIEVVPVTDVLEYETQATVGITISHRNPHKIVDAILENPEVFFAAVSLGRFNLVIGARFRNPNLLNQFITKVLPSIKGITTIETYLHVKRLKYYNLTWIP